MAMGWKEGSKGQNDCSRHEEDLDVFPNRCIGVGLEPFVGCLLQMVEPPPAKCVFWLDDGLDPLHGILQVPNGLIA